mmetsp:Transcript_62921/g.172809  ORF Transcript_62921/g.172809 Transcript_62921/m.172809 type:complete len:498 (+) Transcript_62921:316-1809(+)
MADADLQARVDALASLIDEACGSLRTMPAHAAALSRTQGCTPQPHVRLHGAIPPSRPSCPCLCRPTTTLSRACPSARSAVAVVCGVGVQPELYNERMPHAVSDGMDVVHLFRVEEDRIPSAHRVHVRLAVEPREEVAASEAARACAVDRTGRSSVPSSAELGRRSGGLCSLERQTQQLCRRHESVGRRRCLEQPRRTLETPRVADGQLVASAHLGLLPVLLGVLSAYFGLASAHLGLARCHPLLSALLLPSRAAPGLPPSLLLLRSLLHVRPLGRTLGVGEQHREGEHGAVVSVVLHHEPAALGVRVELDASHPECGFGVRPTTRLRLHLVHELRVQLWLPRCKVAVLVEVEGHVGPCLGRVVLLSGLGQWHRRGRLKDERHLAVAQKATDEERGGALGLCCRDYGHQELRAEGRDRSSGPMVRCLYCGSVLYVLGELFLILRRWVHVNDEGTREPPRLCEVRMSAHGVPQGVDGRICVTRRPALHGNLVNVSPQRA